MMPDMLLGTDDTSTAGFVRRGVRQWAPGTHMAICADGRETLDLLSQSVYRLALVDQELPRLSGLEVLRRARARGLGTPIVLVAGNANRVLAQRVAQLGGQDSLSKPILAATMLALLADFLDAGPIGVNR